MAADTTTASGLLDDLRGGYAHAGEFLKDVWLEGKTGRQPVKLAAWHKAAKTPGHMAAGDDSQGGFMVPTQFIADLQMLTGLDGGIPGRCMQIPMERNSVSIPYVNDVSHTGGVYGGVIVKRTGEAEEKLYSKPTFGLCTMTAHKLTTLTYVTNELMEDSPASIAAMFGKMYSEALNHIVTHDIVHGTGAGMGLGITNAPCTIHVARAGAGAIVWADVINMYERLCPNGLINAVWLANQDTFPALASMFLAGVVPVYHPADADRRTDAHGTLMGLPLILSCHSLPLGETGDLILADLSQMMLGRKGPKVESSAHIRFLHDENVFRGVLRTDNQPWWPAPLTPTHGSQTVSPFIVLDTYPTTTTTRGATTTTAAATTTTAAATTTTQSASTTTAEATTTTKAATTTTAAATTTTAAPTTTTAAPTTTTAAATTTTVAATTTTAAATTTTAAPTTTTD